MSSQNPAPVAADSRVKRALQTAFSYGQISGDHHKAWVIDTMVRALLGNNEEAYRAWVDEYEHGGEYSWDEGVPC